MKTTKAKLVKFAMLAGLAALCWIFDAGGVRGGQQANIPESTPEARVEQPAAAVQQDAPTQTPQLAAADAVAAEPAAAKPVSAETAPATKADSGVSIDGEYDSRDDVASYVRKFGGRLPKNYITKAQARELGWQGGPLEPYAPGKSIGGDHFGNYEHRLPDGRYRECDIGTRGKPRGGKRLIFTTNGKTIYYTDDHYETFRKLEEK